MCWSCIDEVFIVGFGARELQMRISGRTIVWLGAVSALVLPTMMGCAVEDGSAVFETDALMGAEYHSDRPTVSPSDPGAAQTLVQESIAKVVVVGTDCPPGTAEQIVCSDGSAWGGSTQVAGVVPPECWVECVPVVASCGPSGDTGATVFSLHLGDAGDQQQYGIAIDSSGNAIHAGVSWDADTGANTLEIRAVDPAGNVLWLTTKAVSTRSIVSVAAASGAVYVAGSFGLVALDGLGNELWTHAPVTGYPSAPKLAVTSGGHVFFATSFNGQFDFGAGVNVSAGAMDIYVAELNAAGQLLWNKRFGGTKEQRVEGIAVDSGDNLVLAGWFANSLNFGGSVLTSAGSNDVFLAKLGANGVHVWSKRMGDASSQIAFDVAVDGQDDIVLGGALNGSADFGGGLRTSAGSNDAFLAKFTAAGVHKWSRSWGDSLPQYITGVATDPCGNIAVVGHNMGNGEGVGGPGVIDLGGGPLASNGTGIDVFVAKFDPSGGHVYSRIFGGQANETCDSIAAGADGQTVIAYELNADQVDFGQGPMASLGYWDQAVVRFVQ